MRRTDLIEEPHQFAVSECVTREDRAYPPPYATPVKFTGGPLQPQTGYGGGTSKPKTPRPGWAE